LSQIHIPLRSNPGKSLAHRKEKAQMYRVVVSTEHDYQTIHDQNVVEHSRLFREFDDADEERIRLVNKYRNQHYFVTLELNVTK
jgi:hypothetical protein